MIAINECTDNELLVLLRADNRDAFTLIYNRYWKFLYMASYNALRNTHDSMDVCQTVFLWLWENRCEINVQTSLKAYLHTAVKYKIANLIRNGKVRETLLDNLLSADIHADEARELEVKELKSFISQLIHELPEKCREVFLMSREQNLSHRQISEQLRISVKTVDDHITRALKKLRAPLNKMASILLTL